MKYKLFGGAMAVVMLFCALAASAVEAQEGPYRSPPAPDRPPARTRAAAATAAELCTHLPLVVIDTGGEEIPGRAR